MCFFGFSFLSFFLFFLICLFYFFLLFFFFFFFFYYVVSFFFMFFSFNPFFISFFHLYKFLFFSFSVRFVFFFLFLFFIFISCSFLLSFFIFSPSIYEGKNFPKNQNFFSDLPTFTKIPIFYVPVSRNVRSFNPNGGGGKLSNLEKSKTFLLKFDELEYLQQRKFFR